MRTARGWPLTSSKMKALLLLATCAALTSCASRSPIVADSMTLYSPPFLEIPAGAEVLTKAGRYRAQANEVWYSADLYLRRVRESLSK